MSLSVNTAHTLSKHLLSGGLWTAAGALAGAASSVTAVVGAAFGAVNYCASALTSQICNRILNVDHPQTSSITKTAAKILTIFLTLAATVFSMVSAGYPITFGTAVLLTIGSGFTVFIPAVMVGCLASRS